jgi:anti-anti-sigma factor
MLSIDRKIADGIGILSVKGNLIDPDALALTNEVKVMLSGMERKIVIDLSQVQRMNSCYGLGVIMASWGCINRAGGELVISGPNEKIVRLFQITRLNEILKISNTTTEAKQLFRSE